MNIEEACRRVIKDEYNTTTVDDSYLFEHFDINYYYDGNIDYEKLNADLKGYYVQVWYCTDSFVGLTAIYLRDVFVGFSYQKGRKFPVDYYFLSKELQAETKKFVLECCNLDKEDNFVKSPFFYEEIADTFNIYNEQILTQLTNKIKKDGKIIKVFKGEKGRIFNAETNEEITDKMLDVVNNVV